MPPAHNTRAKTPAKNFAPDPLVLLQSTETAADEPSAQLLAGGSGPPDETITIPSSFPLRRQASPPQPAEKRARADTAGTALLSEEEIQRQELQLRIRKLEYEKARF
ncbi:hypothetical protein CHU98_g11721 [Xylaria longipes]|nr:hypothetical protein CHU98_g11721 [Xylaria longipes]